MAISKRMRKVIKEIKRGMHHELAFSQHYKLSNDAFIKIFDLLREDKIVTSFTFQSFMEEDISDEVIKQLAKTLEENQTLNSLVFHNVYSTREEKLSDDAVKQLAKALKKNKTLAKFDFGVFRMTNEGAKYIAEALELNQTLTSFALSYPKTIDRDGMVILADALFKKNKTLKQITLFRNQVDEIVAEHIADGLKENYSIIDIELSCCDINEKGMIALADALKVNKALVSVDFGGNCELGAEVLKEIIDAFKINKNILYTGWIYIPEIEKCIKKNIDLFRSRCERFKRGEKLLQEEAVILFHQLCVHEEKANFSTYNKDIIIYEPHITSLEVREKYAPLWNAELLGEKVYTENQRKELKHPVNRPDIVQAIEESPGITNPLSNLITGYIHELKADPHGRTQLINAVISKNRGYLKETLQIIKALPEEEQRDVLLAKDNYGKSVVAYASVGDIEEIASCLGSKRGLIMAFIADGFSYGGKVSSNVIDSRMPGLSTLAIGPLSDKNNSKENQTIPINQAPFVASSSNNKHSLQRYRNNADIDMTSSSITSFMYSSLSDDNQRTGNFGTKRKYESESNGENIGPKGDKWARKLEEEQKEQNTKEAERKL